MDAYIDYARTLTQAASRRFRRAAPSERGLTTSEIALVLVGLALVAIFLINAIQANVEANVANIPNHSDLP